MPTKSISFNAPTAIKQQYANDPRLIMAQALQKQGSSTAPVQSHLEGIARALQGALGGWQQGKLQDEYQAKGDQYSSDLTGALNTAQTGVPAWTNPDTGQQAIPAVAPGSDALIAGLSSARSPEVKEMGANAMIAKMLQKPETTETERMMAEAGYTPAERQAAIRKIIDAKATPTGLVPYMMGMTPYQQESLNVQRETAQDRQMEREQAKAEKKQAAIEKVSVPGFEVQDGYMPSATDADTLKKAAQAQDLLNSQLNELKLLVEQSGPEIGFGTTQSRMEQLKTNIMLNAKELENLGVLNGPDVGVLEKQLIDPTSLGGWLRDNKTITNSFDNYGKYIGQRVDATAKARGYGKGKQAPAADAGADTAAAPSPGAVVDGYQFKGGNPNDPKNWMAVQ